MNNFNLIVDHNNTFGGDYVDESGQYNVEVAPTTELVTSSKGNPMININYIVLDGKFAGATIDRADHLVWTGDRYSVTRFNDFLVRIGVPDGTQVDSIEKYAKAIVGKRLSVVTEWNQSTNGKFYLRVARHEESIEASSPSGVKRPQEGQTAPQNGGMHNYQQQGQRASQDQSEAYNGAPENAPVPNADDLPF